MKRLFSRKILIVLGVILMAAAVLLTAYNRYEAWRSGQNASFIEQLLREQIEENMRKIPADEPEQDITAVSAFDDEKNEESVKDMPLIEINGYECIGILTVPDFELSLPIVNEWSYEKLQKAPCRYNGSYYTNDLVICGHNYSTHFGRLKQIPVGSMINLLTADGSMYTYEVSNIETMAPTDVEKMTRDDSDDWDLTLFTCTIGGRARCAVRCILTDLADNEQAAGGN